MTNAPLPQPSFQRVPSGLPGLDTILNGGFISGSIYMIQGTPGAGKTILSNQICFNHVASGGRGLFVTLLAENHSRMIGNLRGLAFFDDAAIPDRLSYLAAYNELRDSGLTGLATLIRREIQSRRCSMLVIDGLVSAQTSAPSEQAFKEFVHELQEIALATDCTMFLTTTAADGVSPEHTMVDGLIRLTDRLFGWQSETDLQVTKFRGSGFLRGRHSYKISDAGLTVYPRIEALLATPTRNDAGAKGHLSSGVDGLDRIMGGGLPLASTTILMGPSGTGKTTLGLQFLARSTEAEPGLLLGFYETPARVLDKAAGVCPDLTSLLEAGIVEHLWQPPTGDLLDAYGARLLEAIHRRGVRRLFIDGLTALKSAAIDPDRISNYLASLANELRVLEVTTLYSLEDPKILGADTHALFTDASVLAENIILTRYAQLYSRRHRLLSVLKVRDRQFDATLHEYDITAAGIQIAATSDSAEAILAAQAGHRSSTGGGD